MLEEELASGSSEDSSGSSKYQQMVRNKGYKGSWGRFSLQLTPEYLDQVIPVITRFLKGKQGCKNPKQRQYWVDARFVIEKVTHRITTFRMGEIQIKERDATESEGMTTLQAPNKVIKWNAE